MTVDGLFLSLPIWLVNGLLALVYWLAGHISEVIVIMCGLVIAFGIDPIVQARASERPRRRERGDAQTSLPHATFFTLVVLLIWLAVSLASRFPVPLIGATLWVSGLIAILAVSEERFNQLWWVKAGILTYTVLVLILRFGLQTFQSINPSDWAVVIGSSADAQVVLAATRSNAALIGMLFVFAIYPLGFMGMLFNRSLRNPKPLYNVFLEVGDVLRRLRTRL